MLCAPLANLSHFTFMCFQAIKSKTFWSIHLQKHHFCAICTILLVICICTSVKPWDQKIILKHIIWNILWPFHKPTNITFGTHYNMLVIFTKKHASIYISMYRVTTPLWPSVGVKPNTWKSWELGVLRDSRMFRAR
jgi:hypothetical protein